MSTWPSSVNPGLYSFKHDIFNICTQSVGHLFFLLGVWKGEKRGRKCPNSVMKPVNQSSWVPASPCGLVTPWCDLKSWTSPWTSTPPAPSASMTWWQSALKSGCLHKNNSLPYVFLSVIDFVPHFCLSICNDNASLFRGEVDLNGKNIGGWTPLMYASYIGHDNIANLLLEAGVNVNASTAKGLTPLMLAASCGNESIAYFLLQVQKGSVRE